MLSSERTVISEKPETQHYHQQTLERYCMLYAHTQHENDSINTQCDTNTSHSTLHLCQKLSCSVLDCMAVFRRPEGKFKKKQNPHDEALQILRPQIDNPPAPQVHAHR